MNFNPDYITAIESLGYTPVEAQFLYLAAVHSGYFVPRQFLAFSGAKSGKRSNSFLTKLESRGHATWREYDRIGGVYHLFSITLYRFIGKENLRNRRRHSLEFIRTHLLLLDFVLAHLAFEYLETETEKVHYFCDFLGLPKHALPTKTYEGGPRTEPTLRYFVDKFPLFLDHSLSSAAPAGAPGNPASYATTAGLATTTPPELTTPAAPMTSASSSTPASKLVSCPSPVVTFSYVDPGQPSLAGFATHLHAYLPLLRQLDRFAFLYIASSPVHFVAAERCFASLVLGRLEADLTAEILHYFRLRNRWELKQYGSLSASDIEWLKEATHRFRGERFASSYRAWTTGMLTEKGLLSEFAVVRPHGSVTFETRLVQTTRFEKKSSVEDGEAEDAVP